MPPRRRRNNGRRSNRRKMPIVKLIKRVIQSSAEHKYINTSAGTTNLLASATFISSLTNISEGSNNNSRLGNDITVSKIKFRYHLELLPGGVASAVRVYVVQNFTNVQPSALPGILEIFPALEEANVNYRVLYDRTHELSLGVSQDFFKMVSISGKRFIEVKFDGSTGGTDKGIIQIYFATDNTQANGISVDFKGRSLFTDI